MKNKQSTDFCSNKPMTVLEKCTMTDKSKGCKAGCDQDILNVPNCTRPVKN